MIKLKVSELLNAENALLKLKSKTLSPDDSVSFSLSYKLSKLLDKLNPELIDVYKQRTKILEKFGQKEGEGEEAKFIIPPEQQNNFNKYWSLLMDMDIELFNVFKFNWEELSPITNISLSEIYQLKPFIAEEDFEEQQERQKIEINFEDEDKIEYTENDKE